MITRNDDASVTQPLKFLLIAGVALLLGLRLFFWLSGNMVADEAYYWMWSQHPAISYYDHPPLNAWTLWAASKLVGWNVWALRLMPVLTFLADIWVLWLISKQISTAPKQHFAVTFVLFLSTPIFLTMTMLALPDHLMVLLLLLGLLFFLKFFIPLNEDQPPAWLWLYAACICVGLATLAKYNAVLLGAGVFLYAVFTPNARRIFRHGQSYLAFALFLLVVGPEIYWNINTNASSISFILRDRHAGLPSENNFSGLIGYLAGMVGFLSPFLIWSLAKTLWPRRNTPAGLGIAKFAFWTSSLLFLALSFTTDIMFHWNLVAYIAILPFLAHYVRWGWLTFAHVVYGVLLAAIIAFNFGVLPIRTYFSTADYFSARSFGWTESATRVQTLMAEHDIGFVAGTHYTISAPLGFAMQDANVTDLGSAPSQFRYWFEPAQHLGENALIITHTGNGLGETLADRFETVELVDTIEIYRQGYLVEKRHTYLATNFKN
ncbi:ArnT family glycosyltransferase [Maritalea myrionectae]|uniref:ArnT family glycosyltransferase n=1 Tax=Maritalea myrionectae TaxID=454601 RepID=UPI0004189796|nr:glycosyltransferase family 39 protein [Maritalea myrionectae]